MDEHNFQPGFVADVTFLINLSGNIMMKFAQIRP